MPGRDSGPWQHGTGGISDDTGDLAGVRLCGYGPAAGYQNQVRQQCLETSPEH
jgi:hypothetical protein